MRVEQIGPATLYLGDCRDILPTLPKVDAVITDPPYGIAACWKGGFSGNHGWGKAGADSEVRNEWDAEAPPPELLDTLRAMSKVQCIWGGNYFVLPPSRGWLIWNKPERGFTLSEAELCWTNRDAIVRVIDYRRSDTGRTHPTQKPREVMAWTMDAAKVSNTATVLDPFMGSGTTGVCVIERGGSFIGIEREAKYFDIACKRIALAVAESKQRLFPVDGGAA